jgi:hypothetical protein
MIPPDKPNYIKISLSEQTKTLVEARAKNLGVTTASYLRYLILRDLASTYEKPMFFVLDNLKEIADKLRRVSIMKRIRKL